MMINKQTRFFLVFLLAYSQTLMSQDKGQIATSLSIDTIPFELTNHNNISIMAVFGGADTLDLMFHTAASSVALTTSATQRMESMQWDSESDVGSWGGRSTSRYSQYNTVEIGKLQWDNVAVWEDENSGPTTDGKFGPNLFEGYIIEIDFDNKLLILYQSLPTKTADYVKMPVVFENDNYFIQGTSAIAGVDYVNQFLIHSGYGGALLFDDQFAMETKIGERIEITDEKELKDSFGNVIKVNKGVLPEFMIGDMVLNDVPVGFFQGKIGRQQMSVMGADILKRFNMIIDARENYIYLKANELMDTAYTQF